MTVDPLESSAQMANWQQTQQTQSELAIQQIKQLLISEVQAAIKLTVNGKIDALSKKMDEHVVIHNEQWEQLKPVADAFANYSGFRKSVAVIFGPLAYTVGIGSGLALIFEYFKH